jgi:polysaccharide pyruvyl transferase WcaK-like protein
MNNALLISDTSDGGNWGCYATSGELRAIINNKVNITNTLFLNETGINDKGFILPSKYDVGYIGDEFANSIMNEKGIIRKMYYSAKSSVHLFDMLPKTADQFEHRAKKFVDADLVTEYFGQIEDLDHVIINGEGSIHDSGVSRYRIRSWSLLFLAYIAKKELGLKTHIINHTLEINTERFKSIVNLVYPLMDSVIFRDPFSIVEYKAKTNCKNGIQAADAAWLMDNNICAKTLNRCCNDNIISIWHADKKRPNFDFTEPYICVGGGSGLQKSIDEKVTEIVSIIDGIQRQLPNLNILLTAASNADETFMLHVSEETDVNLLKTNNNQHLAASILANSELYLGGRWHESIFALLGNTQLVNFSGNTFKIESLREHIGTNHPVYSGDDIGSNTETIINSVKEGVRNGFYNEIPTKNMKLLSQKNANFI